MLPELSEIRSIRKKLGITQQQLSRLSGVSQSLIAKIEKTGSKRIDPAYSKVLALFNSLWSYKSSDRACAGSLMNKRLITVRATEKIDKVSSLMLKNSISQVPVLDQNGSLYGSISEECIIEALHKNMIVPGKTTAFDIAEEPFPLVSETTPVDALIDLLKHHKAVLVGKRGKPIGIITKADLFKTL